MIGVLITFWASLLIIGIIMIRQIWKLTTKPKLVARIRREISHPLSPVNIIHGMRDMAFWFVSIIVMSVVSLLSGIRAFFQEGINSIDRLID